MVSSWPQENILNLITLSIPVVFFWETQKQSAIVIPSEKTISHCSRE